MKILVVEDDNCSAKVLEQVLTSLNYKAEIAKDGETGLALAQQFEYDLLILDIMLPKLDGVSLCHQLRLQGHQMPILMLTSQSDTSVRVNSLEVGADDYVVKPFNLSELIARIRALLRRGKTISTKVLTWENLRLDTTTKEVVYAGKRLHLTPKEYGLLEIFLQNPRRVFSRSVLLDKIWSADEFPGEEAVTTQIKGLRQKLKTNGMNADFIETVYGLGYRLKEDPKSLRSEVAQKRQTEANVMSLVSKMGEEFLETLPQKLALIEQAIAQLSNLNPDSHILQQAQTEAHRLAGSLGCYGFCECSKIAQNIEQLLEKRNTETQNTALQLTELIKLFKQNLQKPPSLSGTVPVSEVKSAQLLIIDDDQDLCKRIRLEAVASGLQVQIASQLKAARSLIALHSPDVILLDLSFANEDENGLAFLAELTKNYPQIPVLVFSVNNQLQKRVEAARLGAHSFLHKTMSASAVINTIKTALNQNHTNTDAKILVVDDDPIVLNQISNLLSPWGLHITTLQDTQIFWEILELNQPDLLILDIKMPHFNGIELCNAVRNDPRWSYLPVLFVSVHVDTETISQIYAVGADDYIRKPILEPELIARVLRRLERKQRR